MIVEGHFYLDLQFILCQGFINAKDSELLIIDNLKRNLDNKTRFNTLNTY